MILADLLTDTLLLAFLVGSTIDYSSILRDVVPYEIAVYLDGVDGESEDFHRLI